MRVDQDLTTAVKHVQLCTTKM